MADDDEPQDAMLQGLMEQTFGPKDGADSGERMQRGLEEMARLSVARPDFVRRWLHETPPAEAPPANTERLCFRCGAGGAAATCAKCGVACYCSRECQKADWGKGGAFGGHKSLCERYKWLGREQRVPPEEHRTILTELITRTKLYVCPFFVHHAERSAPGSGFGFVQSECTLAELALPAPRDVWGQPLAQPRSLVIMWMSLEEFPEYVAETGDTRAHPQSCWRRRRRPGQRTSYCCWCARAAARAPRSWCPWCPSCASAAPLPPSTLASLYCSST